VPPEIPPGNHLHLWNHGRESHGRSSRGSRRHLSFSLLVLVEVNGTELFGDFRQRSSKGQRKIDSESIRLRFPRFVKTDPYPPPTCKNH